MASIQWSRRLLFGGRNGASRSAAAAAAAAAGLGGGSFVLCSDHLLPGAPEPLSTKASRSRAPFPWLSPPWAFGASDASPEIGLGFKRSGIVRCEDSSSEQIRYGTIRLRDGRVLSYHDEGSGVPVFAFHGMGSSRLTWLSDKPLSQICPGARIIAVDRPGYGGSSPPPFGYSYTEFTRDVIELADALKLPRFCVAGHSSGGPYALAAAAELGPRVAAAAAVCSDAPYAHPQTPQALREADSTSQSALLFSDGLYGQEPRAFAEGLRANSLKKGLPTKAHAWKTGVDGWLCDWMLERLPWSFAIEKIALGPKLTVWFGGEDFEAIKIGAPFLQSLVPGSQLRVVEGGNHVFKSEPEHLAAILTELMRHF